MIVVETQRLYLKTFSQDDVPGFFELNNDPLVLKYTGDKPFKDKEEVSRFIKDYDQYKKHGFGRWSVYLKETNCYLGFSGLRYSSETDEIDIGFRFMQKFWGMGFATESAIAALELAFTRYNAQKVVARAMQDNLASHAVIKKLGMTYQSSFQEDGKLWSKYQFLKENWRGY